MDQLDLFQSVALTVSDLTHYLRQVFESDEILRDVWVRGEISNLSRPSSGHIYFTLKDSGAALRAVIWKGNALRLRMELREGMSVEAHGAITIYEPRGEYQIIVDALRLAGEGALYQEFLRLKARLEAEGLFDTSHKRLLPPSPQRIGIVTSPSGAALQDMLNTLRRRYPLAEVILAPAAVQGDSAPGEIVAALATLDRLAPDVILVARGGGSLEDLWAFNDERVVRAIAASSVPVITGVGHETDFTLADFAADVRAPTPTGAAVMATPDIADIHTQLGVLTDRLAGALEAVVDEQRVLLDATRYRLQRASPLWQVQTDRQRLDEMTERARRALANTLALNTAHFHALDGRLHSLDPLAVLGRGYAVVSDAEGRIIRSMGKVQPGDGIDVRLVDGRLDATVNRRVGLRDND
ncbi:MAG: exodeoxyribonuclease VII large subunit [Anaerolineaceae bacterium]|jgi:exodeoxyribonuclease VII large subunit